MKDDKKKLMIVGVLALVIVAVGAFQLLGGGGSKRHAPAAAAATSAKPKDGAPPKVATVEKINPFKNSPLPDRDPFQAGTLAPIDPNAPALPIAQPATQPQKQLTFDHNAAMSGTLPTPTDRPTVAPLHVEPPQFAYQLVGVIDGPRPAAVFQDSEGNQRLVQAGGSVDGDSRVVSINDGDVKVEFKNKTLHLKPGGNPSGH